MIVLLYPLHELFHFLSVDIKVLIQNSVTIAFMGKWALNFKRQVHTWKFATEPFRRLGTAQLPHILNVILGTCILERNRSKYETIPPFFDIVFVISLRTEKSFTSCNSNSLHKISHMGLLRKGIWRMKSLILHCSYLPDIWQRSKSPFHHNLDPFP